MLDSGPRSLREAAAKILAWIVCANMLLKKQEIQSIFFIDPKTSTLEYTFRKLQKSCKGICGSLVDLQFLSTERASEATVYIVHETARG